MKWSKKVTNEKVLKRIGKNSTLLSNILRRKVNWIGPKKKLSSSRSTEGKMTEAKGIGKRKTQLLYDLRNRKIYWKQKEETDDRKRRKQQYITGT